MNKFNILGYYLFTTICLFGGCKQTPLVEKSFRTYIKNNSNLTIAFLVSYNYPDTIIPNEEGKLKVIISMDYYFLDNNKNWNDILAENNATKISFYFFNNDTTGVLTF